MELTATAWNMSASTLQWKYPLVLKYSYRNSAVWTKQSVELFFFSASLGSSHYTSPEHHLCQDVVLNSLYSNLSSSHTDASACTGCALVSLTHAWPKAATRRRGETATGLHVRIQHKGSRYVCIIAVRLGFPYCLIREPQPEAPHRCVARVEIQHTTFLTTI